MAELESEAMLIGNWTSIVELEDTISLVELQAILNAYRKSIENNQRFLAALQGIDLEESQTAQDRLDEMKERIEREQRARREGTSADALEWEDLGITVETGV